MMKYIFSFIVFSFIYHFLIDIINTNERHTVTETVKYTHFELAIQKRVASSTWNIGKRVARSSWGIGKRVGRSSWGFPKQPTARANDTLPRS